VKPSFSARPHSSAVSFQFEGAFFAVLLQEQDARVATEDILFLIAENTAAPRAYYR
jgi:hypothetical protein